MTGGHAAEHPSDGGQRFGGMHVLEPAFADDDGSADPALAAALARHAAGASVAEVVAALRGRRLMVPLLAVLDTLAVPDEVPYWSERLTTPGPAGAHEHPIEPSSGSLHRPGPGEKDSHMATVSLVGADGRRGLLAFTSVASMTAWDAGARGIPASAERVAASALDEGADAVLLDIAGPLRFVLTGPALRAVAAGQPWAPAWEDVEVRGAVAAALAGVDGLAAHRLVPGQAPAGEAAPDVLVLLEVAGPDVAAVAQSAADALADVALLAELCPGGVGLALG